jgi:hypothetical protein
LEELRNAGVVWIQKNHCSFLQTIGHLIFSGFLSATTQWQQEVFSKKSKENHKILLQLQIFSLI